MKLFDCQAKINPNSETTENHLITNWKREFYMALISSIDPYGFFKPILCDNCYSKILPKLLGVVEALCELDNWIVTLAY